MAYHGQKPIILDITTAYEDEDHTVALFRDKKYWGALSKTNHAVLRYRDPIYISPREIAMTYFNEYYMWDSGHKTMRAYATFDLSIFPPERWIIAEDLDWLMKRMSNAYYKDAVPTRLLPKLRRASELERKILSNTEWSKTGKRLYK